jgi:hypothetical protein
MLPPMSLNPAKSVWHTEGICLSGPRHWNREIRRDPGGIFRNERHGPGFRSHLHEQTPTPLVSYFFGIFHPGPVAPSGP